MWFSPGTLKLGAGASPLLNHLSGKRCHQDRDQVPTQNPDWTGSHVLSNIQEKVYVAKALFKMESIAEAWAKESGWKKSQWWGGKREFGSEMMLLTLVSLGPRGTSRSLMGPGTWHVPWSRDICCSRTYWMLNKQLLCEWKNRWFTIYKIKHELFKKYSLFLSNVIWE